MSALTALLCSCRQIIVLELSSSVMEDTYFTQALFPSVKAAAEAVTPSTADFYSKLAQRGGGGLLDFLLHVATTLGGVNVDVVFSAAYSSFGKHTLLINNALLLTIDHLSRSLFVCQSHQPQAATSRQL